MDFSVALPTFVITLREGVEAALVVGIVLACLRKAKQSRLNAWVYGGTGAGGVASIGLGLILSQALARIQSFSPEVEAVAEPLLKLSLCGLAIAMLSWMLIWMTQQAQALKGEIESTVQRTLMNEGAANSEAQPERLWSRAGWGVFWLVLIAVLREGFEMVVFVLANAQQGLSALLGAGAGLMGAAIIGVALFKFGVRINLGRFFQVMGMLLLLIVAGLVMSLLKYADGLAIAWGHLQGNNLCLFETTCLLGPQIWDFSGWLPQRAFPGLLLKSLLGYRDHLYAVQAIAYLAFLSTVGGLYLQSLDRETTPPDNPSKATRRSSEA